MLKVEREGPVLRLTLDRPQVRNALDEALIDALVSAITALPAGVRAVVISGTGDAFCAGGDLGYMRRQGTMSIEDNISDAIRVAGLFQSIVESPAVFVAAVNGACMGGGCGIVAAADVAIAADHARFAFREVRVGLIPATISPHVIAKIGAGNARALFVTGEEFDADRAQRIGLVHQVVPAASLHPAVSHVVANVLAGAPKAIAAAKRLAISPPASATEAAEILARIRSGDEAAEGLQAFLDKRAPSFRETL